MSDYKDAGVDIEGVDKLLSKRFDISKFSAVFNQPIEGKLVLSCDGVGTKSKIAQWWQRYDTIGIDLVAMVANDIITTGAKPFAFMDYIGLQKFDECMLNDLLSGINEGCSIAGCELVGGETAEMPDVYAEDPCGRLAFELAGFGLGVLSKTNPLLSGQDIVAGDVLIGLPSSGFHSNGYSLLRKIMFEWTTYCDEGWSEIFGKNLADVLLEPTTIYVKDVEAIAFKYPIKALVHITGGGMRNIQRVLPTGLTYKLDKWDVPHVFKMIQEHGNLVESYMYDVFNMGVGMVIVAREDIAKRIEGIRVGRVVPK